MPLVRPHQEIPRWESTATTRHHAGALPSNPKRSLSAYKQPFSGDCHKKDNIESLSGQSLFLLELICRRRVLTYPFGPLIVNVSGLKVWKIRYFKGMIDDIG